jgi:large subunit ribosomal protein LP0
MAQVRVALRNKGIVLMGKNTVMRRIIRSETENHPKLGALLELITGNVGFVFTNGDMAEIRKIIQSNKVPAAAKVGVAAPSDVVVPAGPTGLDPGQTNFFQVLEIATKISRGAIEIINDVKLIKQGEKVTPSHVSLLSKLNIKPFSYGMIVVSAYEDGSTYSARVLDMTRADLLNIWFTGVRHVAVLSIVSGCPTQASIPFSVRDAMRKVFALAFATGYDFKESKNLAEAAKNAPKAEVKKEAAKEAEPEEEEAEEESDGPVGLGGGMFGDD